MGRHNRSASLRSDDESVGMSSSSSSVFTKMQQPRGKHPGESNCRVRHPGCTLRVKVSSWRSWSIKAWVEVEAELKLEGAAAFASTFRVSAIASALVPLASAWPEARSLTGAT